jgi:hypothetical protein
MGFERLLRKLTLSYSSNIQLLCGTVTEVVTTEDGTSIASVRYRDTGGISPAIHAIDCSLFVDCTGVTSLYTKILPRASDKWGPFPRISYDPKVIYATAMPQLTADNWKALADIIPPERSDASGRPQLLVRVRVIHCWDGRMLCIQRGANDRSAFSSLVLPC